MKLLTPRFGIPRGNGVVGAVSASGGEATQVQTAVEVEPRHCDPTRPGGLGRGTRFTTRKHNLWYSPGLSDPRGSV
jgi:hypothetical protein